MQKLLLLTAVFLSLGFANVALADKYVNGYTKKDGTYVQGYTKSEPDQYRYNNKSSQTNGGTQRDEYSNGTGATNKSNSTYNYRDNDKDGVYNPYDSKPESSNNCTGYNC